MNQMEATPAGPSRPLPPDDERGVATRSLADLPRGAPAVVDAIEVNGALGERLMELGVTPGVPISLVRTGPFGDPLQVLVRGTHLSLRRELARHIRVRPPVEIPGASP